MPRFSNTPIFPTVVFQSGSNNRLSNGQTAILEFDSTVRVLYIQNTSPNADALILLNAGISSTEDLPNNKNFHIRVNRNPDRVGDGTGAPLTNHIVTLAEIGVKNLKIQAVCTAPAEIVLWGSTNEVTLPLWGIT